jgi:hypothetical protein
LTHCLFLQANKRTMKDMAFFMRLWMMRLNDEITTAFLSFLVAKWLTVSQSHLKHICPRANKQGMLFPTFEFEWNVVREKFYCQMEFNLVTQAPLGSGSLEHTWNQLRTRTKVICTIYKAGGEPNPQFEEVTGMQSGSTSSAKPKSNQIFWKKSVPIVAIF